MFSPERTGPDNQQTLDAKALLRRHFVLSASRLTMP